ncbi:Ion channel [Teladorsagia circumcincta]|uniref:Ion channel n=1 Tax=Teladorsagia circumcincta TaxID=45464 RepID=A0A2G9TV38_TELCI|nr:Ion channel [Teladorsagia circumcincta]
MYGNYLKLKHFICVRRRGERKERREHVCEHCQRHGIGHDMHVIEEQRIPALLVLAILVLYTALGGVLMSKLEPWSFFTSFYWSFITMTTVGFGDLMPRRDEYMYIILLYIILGLAITTMCIDLVGVQYIRKIHYFGRKIQDARSALAVVGGKIYRSTCRRIVIDIILVSGLAQLSILPLAIQLQPTKSTYRRTLAIINPNLIAIT